MKDVAKREVPTLVKYADSLPYLQKTQAALVNRVHQTGADPDSEADWCKLISYNPEGENQILAAALYRFGDASYESYLQKMSRMQKADKMFIAKKLLDELGPHDIPIRELEHSLFTF